MTRTRPGSVRLAVAIFAAATATGLLVVTVLQELSLDTAAIAFPLGVRSV